MNPAHMNAGMILSGRCFGVVVLIEIHVGAGFKPAPTDCNRGPPPIVDGDDPVATETQRAPDVHFPGKLTAIVVGATGWSPTEEDDINGVHVATVTGVGCRAVPRPWAGDISVSTR